MWARILGLGVAWLALSQGASNNDERGRDSPPKAARSIKIGNNMQVLRDDDELIDYDPTLKLVDTNMFGLNSTSWPGSTSYTIPALYPRHENNGMYLRYKAGLRKPGKPNLPLMAVTTMFPPNHETFVSGLLEAHRALIVTCQNSHLSQIKGTWKTRYKPCPHMALKNPFTLGRNMSDYHRTQLIELLKWKKGKTPMVFYPNEPIQDGKKYTYLICEKGNTNCDTRLDSTY